MYTTFKLRWTRFLKKKLKKRRRNDNAIYDSLTPATLKQGQCNQTWYELVDPEQRYNNANTAITVHSTACRFLLHTLHWKITLCFCFVLFCLFF